jgi:hypothetical protein
MTTQTNNTNKHIIACNQGEIQLTNGFYTDPTLEVVNPAPTEPVQISAFPDAPVELDAPVEPDKSLIKSYMISITSGTSYDIPQSLVISSNGLMETLRISYNLLHIIANIMFEIDIKFNGQNEIAEARKIVDIIHKFSNKNVIFNFECCSHLENHMFPQNKQRKKIIMNFIAQLVRHGYTLVFADFSVFSLINEWSTCSNVGFASMLLGECPFMIHKEKCNQCMHLEYAVDELIGSPIPQLQVLGKLSETGTCQLRAMEGTVVFGKKEVCNPICLVSVYTTVTKYDTFTCCKNSGVCSAVGIKETGFIGHAVATYPEGGKLILSAGHFCELSKIHTSNSRLSQVIDQMPEQMRRQYTQELQRAEQMNMYEREVIYTSLSSDVIRTTSC